MRNSYRIFDEEHSRAYLNIITLISLAVANILSLINIMQGYTIVKLNIVIELIISIINILFIADIITNMNVMVGNWFNSNIQLMIVRTAVVGIIYTIYDYKTTHTTNILRFSCIITSFLILATIILAYIGIKLDDLKERRKTWKC